MSMSTAADIVAGSRLPTSSTIGKLRVWSEARFWPPPPPPPPQATAIEIAPNATARERNVAIRDMPPPTEHGSRRAHLKAQLSSKSIALFPVARGASSPPATLCHLPMAPLLHVHI